MGNARVEGAKFVLVGNFFLRNTCSTVRGPAARHLANFMEIHVMNPGKGSPGFLEQGPLRAGCPRLK